MLMTRGWCFVALLSLYIGVGSAEITVNHRRRYAKAPPPSYPTIVVDQSGGGNFTTIQSAIDSIPVDNNDWICIYVKAGEYREQVSIPSNKPFIYLKGDGKRRTSIVWGDYTSITNPTFMSQADNFVAKSITFWNSYNNPPGSNPRRAAVAAMISGDKSAFYRCAFLGFQDTLWDVQGRHYFKLCTIQGAVDFIFGAGQSIYERCTISVNAGALNGLGGFITAQARSNPDETNGFVFKECNVIGSGMAYLGRPWKQYARVIFYNTSLSHVVIPEGWNAWGNAGRKEYMLTFAESDCYGDGFLPRKRVNWEAKLSQDTLSEFTSMSYIDKEGWISQQPFNMLNR